MKVVTDDNLTEFKRKCDEIYVNKADAGNTQNAVLFIPQALQAEQQNQARQNINAQVAGSYITEQQFNIKADQTYVDQELDKKLDITEYNAEIILKQDITDNALTTTDKTVSGAINELKTAVDGIRNDIINEAHFRGWFATNAELQETPADINDYAYSAESGTVWRYNGAAWEDTGEPVPDKATPLSDSTPIQDGTASPGMAGTAARGDHVHPTDTSRASNTEFQQHVTNKQNPHGVTATQIGAYVKPQTGIPKTDLEAAVQQTLDKVPTLPSISATDNDKVLGVVAGAWGLIVAMTKEEVDALFA